MGADPALSKQQDLNVSTCGRGEEGAEPKHRLLERRAEVGINKRSTHAAHHGVPSSPRSFFGRFLLSKNTAMPKSGAGCAQDPQVPVALHGLKKNGQIPMAFMGELSSLSRSMKFPGLMSRCRIPLSWHCTSVRRTACMILATCRGFAGSKG